MLILRPSHRRLVSFFAAIAWVCFYDSSAATRTTIAVIAGVSAALLALIVHNGDWEAPERLVTLSARMSKTAHTLKKAPSRATRNVRRYVTLASHTLLASFGSSRKKGSSGAGNAGVGVGTDAVPLREVIVPAGPEALPSREVVEQRV